MFQSYDATGQNFRHNRHLAPWHAGLVMMFCVALLPHALGELCPPRPFKIHVEYQLRPEMPTGLREYLQTKLVPTAQAVISTLFKVKNRQCGNLKLQPTRCDVEDGPRGCIAASYDSSPAIIPDKLKAPGYGSKGGPGVDADFVLFVLTQEECGTYFAFGRLLTQDWDTNRPTSGSIIMCQFDQSTFESDLDTVIHEAFHALVMNTKFFLPEPSSWPPTSNGQPRYNSFIDSTGRELTPREIVDTSYDAANREIHKVVTPFVVDYMRQHFHCPTADGAALEDDGKVFTRVWHWEARLFEGEMMTGVIGSRTFGGRSRISKLTLNLMKDSGWYDVEQQVQDSNTWGDGGGCVFLETKCAQAQTAVWNKPRINKFFCDQGSAGITSCTDDYSGYGTCGTKELSVFPNKAVNVLDGCNLVEAGDNQDCVSDGPGSRCISKIIPKDIAFGNNVAATCKTMKCRDGLLYLVIQGREYRCPSGQMVNNPDMFDDPLSEAFGPCPPNHLMCGVEEPAKGWLECPNDCSGKGDCLRGRCRCLSGRAGPDCSQIVCLDSRQCTGGKACTNGVCMATTGGLTGPEPTTTSPSMPAPVPVTPSPGGCSPIWGQCDGLGWNGPKCCVAGTRCIQQIINGVLNPYYSQCTPAV